MDLQQLGELISSETVKSAAGILAGEITKMCIKPLLEKISSKNQGIDSYEDIEMILNEYFDVCFRENIYMKTIVFRGQNKTLNELYIPLTIEEIVSSNEEVREYRIDETVYTLFKDFSRIMIIDTAGMGKSTIVKFLIIKLIMDGEAIPVNIELRKLRTDETILQHLKQELQLIGSSLTDAQIIDLLKEGEFVVFFDGYDEISEINKASVTIEMQEFIRKVPNIKFVLTSREESELYSFSGFQKFGIKPLARKEAYDLIKKYDNYGELAEKLIERLNTEKDLTILSEFLTNPLLVSLLYKTFEYKEEIPYKKIGFYSQIYEALFNDHDKIKGGAYVHEKLSGLDSYDFSNVLKALGYLSLNNQKIEFDKSELLFFIKKSLDYTSNVKVKPESFLLDICQNVPFFQFDGKYYKWAHKSFMEYFSAKYIIEDAKNRDYILKEMATKNTDRFMNVLDFCYDLNPKIFRKTIILPKLEELLKEKKYTQTYYSKFDHALVKLRENYNLTADGKFVVDEKYKGETNIFEFDYGCFQDALNVAVFDKCEEKTAMHIETLGFALVTGWKINLSLLQLLFSKKVDIFMDPLSLMYDSEIDFVIEKALYEVKKPIIPIDDKIDSFLNNQEYFEKTAFFLYDHVRLDRGQLLDVDKCISLRESICNENKIECDDLFQFLI